MTDHITIKVHQWRQAFFLVTQEPIKYSCKHAILENSQSFGKGISMQWWYPIVSCLFLPDEITMSCFFLWCNCFPSSLDVACSHCAIQLHSHLVIIKLSTCVHQIQSYHWTAPFNHLTKTINCVGNLLCCIQLIHTLESPSQASSHIWYNLLGCQVLPPCFSIHSIEQHVTGFLWIMECMIFHYPGVFSGSNAVDFLWNVLKDQRLIQDTIFV